MNINGKDYRAIWLSADQVTVEIIDQRYLPFDFVVEPLRNVNEMAIAIKDMHLRGAPCIGVAAGFGVYLAALEAQKKEDWQSFLNQAKDLLLSTRPTAINLHWAINRCFSAIEECHSINEVIKITKKTAQNIADEEVATCAQIGQYGLQIIKELAQKGSAPLNILTHCNAGAMATVDHGTATAPIYAAFEQGINLHVWVDETRPRNQGKITAWEMEQNNIPYTIIPDNTGGYLMMKQKVDMVIVGTDRVAANGDVANKIGTYLKALAAHDNNIPFYVALPSSTYDPQLPEGVHSIPIEERSTQEVLFIEGKDQNNQLKSLQLFSNQAKAANYAFDVTPARLITGFITEKGIFKPEELKEKLK
ncbi:MAG: S-methyl-5-thioribose-1-phosphate isomerase [Spirochaetes bacterium]|nr:S-methyl-5-thioribose-1-phosphate isomerase [Spirochaetota bacterium]